MRERKILFLVENRNSILEKSTQKVCFVSLSVSYREKLIFLISLIVAFYRFHEILAHYTTSSALILVN